MIGGLAVLLLFQLAGEAISSAFALPVPGPVIGMLLLFLALLARGQAPRQVDAAGEGLLKHLSLFFVPAGSGIIAYLALIRREWLPIAVSLIGSTIITIAVTALTMRLVAGRRGPPDAFLRAGAGETDGEEERGE